MKIIWILLAFLNTLVLSGQQFELFGGPVKNTFYDFMNKDGHFMSSYNSGLGYSAGIGMDSVKVDWLTIRFTLNIDKYGGNLDASYGGLAGGSGTKATISKSLVSLGIYPINFRILKRIDLNIGMEMSGLIDESFTGIVSGWSLQIPGWYPESYSYKLEDENKRYSAKNYFGLQGRIAYNINLSPAIILAPQYSYYFGMSNEFDEFPQETKSMRHYFCLGIKTKFK